MHAVAAVTPGKGPVLQPGQVAVSGAACRCGSVKSAFTVLSVLVLLGFVSCCQSWCPYRLLSMPRSSVVFMPHSRMVEAIFPGIRRACDFCIRRRKQTASTGPLLTPCRPEGT